MATTCEENEVELSLGLSIGGCFRKPKKPAPIVEKSGENDTDIRSSLSPISIGFIALGEGKGLCGEEDLDPQQRREIHALRRQAARRKREEKQQKRGIVRGRNGGYVNSCVPGRTGSMDEKMMLEALEFQSRVRDREAMENETSGSEPICKKVKSENGGSGSTGVTDDDQEDKSQILEQNQSPNPNRFPYASAPFPVVPMQYPFPHLQYVPFGNGFTFPYGMPYWASPAVAVGDDKSAFKPIACQARRPYQTPSSNGNHKSSASCDSEQNGSKGCGIKQAQSSTCSSASPGSSSSGVSDYHRTSQQGGSSSDTRSFSSGSPSEIPQLHTSFVHNAQGQSELSASSHPVESTQDIEEATHYVGKVVSSNTSQPSPRKTEENPISTTESFPNDKPITTTDNPPPLLPHPSKEAKEDSTKPPRPPQPPQPPALPQMPCVSTTGNGPNGKTINGFLYRYNKTEVSIMCVCHGSSFSPAEFVKHAGGTDVSHPLRQIVVVPSAF